MLSPAVLRRALALVGLSGCSTVLGIEDLVIADAGGPPPPQDGIDGQVFTVDCKAQRAVHLVGGNGGLAWFTLEWPVTNVITSFQVGFAYDNPANAKDVGGGSTTHPLFARKIGARALWEGTGSSPQPSVFIAGQNQTHTATPNTSSGGGTEILAAAALLQKESLDPPVPVVAFRVGPYGPVTGAPTPLQVTTTDQAVDAMIQMGVVSSTVADSQLRPSASQLATYGVGAGSPMTINNLGSQLAFAANAFRLGLVGSVLISAFNDDPHGAFDNGIATARADQLAKILDAFYTELATSNELSCGKNGQALSLADNTVLFVTGDTYKNPFMSGGWPDGTPQNSNLIYVRANGYLKRGWFGAVPNAQMKTNWNIQTGDLDATAPDGKDSMVAGVIYAIARGDGLTVARFSAANFAGTVGTPP